MKMKNSRNSRQTAQDAADAALFAAEVRRHGQQAQAASANVGLRERSLVTFVLGMASPDPPGDPDTRTEIEKRLAGWLGELIEAHDTPQLATLTRGYFPAWSAEARGVQVIPVFDLVENKVHLRHIVAGGREVAMMAYALMLLLDQERDLLYLLGRCRYCGRFFLAERPTKPGPPERLFCSTRGHKQAWTNQESARRVKAWRADRKKPTRRTR